MLLYQPSDNEIKIACARLIHRHPSMTARVTKAAATLADIENCFDCDDTDRWNIRSSAGSVNWYAVTPTACDCPDRATFCKHRLAFHGYRHLLTNELQRRMVGNLKFYHERRRAEYHIGSTLAVTEGKRPRAVAYTGHNRFPRHLCYLRLDSMDRLVPHSLCDYVALAEWLPTVPKFSIAMPEPRMEDYAPDRQPEMSRADFNHWLATGDTPNMRLAF